MAELGLELEWRDGQWEGKYAFPYWKDFRVVFPGEEDFLDGDGPEKKAGIYDIFFSDEAKSGLTDAQRRVVELLNEHQYDIAQSILRAIFGYIRKLNNSSNYGDLIFLQDFRRVIEFEALTVMEFGKDPGGYTTVDHDGQRELVYIRPRISEGLAYVGFCFNCLWDEEHGLGVLLHGRNVVVVGEAAVGFDQSQIAYFETKRREGGEAGV